MLLEYDYNEAQPLGLDTSISKLREIKFQITTSHDPIYIDGDTNFTATAAKEGWPGTGTLNDPFIIENYRITTNGNTAISINNTQVYFQIKNCEVNSTALMLNTGYQLVNVSHGALLNNTATSFYYPISLTNSSFNRIEGNAFATTLAIFGVGFNLWNSSENSFTNNVVDSFRWGFQLSYSNSNTLTHNVVKNCSEYAFQLYRSHWNNLSINTIKDGSTGFYLSYSHSNIMNENTVVQNNIPVFLIDSFYNRFTINNFSNNDQNIRCLNSSWNEFINNVVFNHSSGWSLESNSSYNTISWNSIIDTGYHGLYLPSGSYNNITWNSFLNSKVIGSQIYDHTTNVGNKIEYNHYNDHLTPDINQDGIVDTSYAMTGGSGNTDPFPRVAPIWINENSDFTMLGLTGNGTINNPYIIRNTHFKSNKSVLIFICNTTANFAIHNSVFDGVNKQYSVIELYNTTNGLIENNHVRNGIRGIRVISSSNQVELIGNIVTNCTYGIVINSSTQNTITTNTLVDNWINALDDSNGTNIWNRNSYGLNPEGVPYQIHGTAQSYDMNPTALDTDNDQIPDWYEIAVGMNRFFADSNEDLDVDGMGNLWEYKMGLNASNPLDAFEDTEKDGLTNLQEFTFGSNANLADTDTDYLPDLYEYQNGLNPTTNDSTFDADGDGLFNLQEYLFGSYANKSDSDDDGMPDLFEYQYFLQPMIDDSDFDPDSDGYTNLEEFQNGTNPRISDIKPPSSTTQVSETTETSTTSAVSTQTTTSTESTSEAGPGFLSIELITMIALISILIKKKRMRI